jgi:hypothetical protein
MTESIHSCCWNEGKKPSPPKEIAQDNFTFPFESRQQHKKNYFSFPTMTRGKNKGGGIEKRENYLL